VKPYEKITKVPVRFKEVLHLLASNKRVMLFLFASTMMGTGYSFIDNFLFLFLDELGGPTVLMGFTVVLTVSTEIPLFQMSERMHRIFTERNMMTISMSVWTFRVVCYSLLRNPWWVLLIEPLHGVTFAFMWLPSMHLIARAFPPKLSSSATGVLFTLTSGVGPMIGNLVAGTLYKVAGPRVMFRCAASVMLLSLLFYLTADYVLERRGVPIVCDYDAADTAAATDVAVTADECGKQGDPDSDEPRKVDKVSRSAQENEGVHGGRQSALDVVDGELPE
jgi:MFS transporter, PPP family, 3-phenylpropionic acid transporter